MPLIIITGNPVDGHIFWGPFDEGDDDITDQFHDTEWWSAELRPLEVPDPTQDLHRFEVRYEHIEQRVFITPPCRAEDVEHLFENGHGEDSFSDVASGPTILQIKKLDV